MNLKVDYNELDNIGKYITQKDLELKNNLDEVLVLFNSVGECWKGIDSQNFIAKSTGYVTAQIRERERLGRLGNTLSKISSKYSENDIEWERQMRKMGVRR